MTNVVQFEAWLTRAEVATYFRVSERTVDRWVAEGAPSETWGARFRRFRLTELDRWLSERSKAA